MGTLPVVESHRAEILSGSGWSFALKSLALGCNLGFQILVARRLGAAGAGVYFLALVTATVAATVSRGGLENVLLRRFSAALGRGAWGEVAGDWRQGLCTTTVGGLVLGAALFLGAGPLARVLQQELDFVFVIRWTAPMVLPLAFGGLFAEAFRGVGQLRTSILVQEVGPPVLAAAVFLLLDPARGPVIAVQAYGVAVTAMMVVGFVRWRRAASPAREAEPVVPRLGELLRSGAPLLGVNLMILLPRWTSLYLIGALYGRAEVGRFGIALRLALLTSFVLLAVTVASKKKFAELYASGRLRELRRAAVSATWLSILGALPLALPFLLVPGRVLAMMGEDFAGAAPVLVVLVLGQVFSAASGAVGALLTMTGHERVLHRSVLVATVVTLALAAGLIPFWGGIGAAIAVATGLCLRNALCILAVRRHLGFTVWTSGSSARAGGGT